MLLSWSIKAGCRKKTWSNIGWIRHWSKIISRVIIVFFLSYRRIFMNILIMRSKWCWGNRRCCWINIIRSNISTRIYSRNWKVFRTRHMVFHRLIRILMKIKWYLNRRYLFGYWCVDWECADQNTEFGE